MAGAAINGTGLAITYESGTYTGKVTSVDWGGITRPAIDVTNFSSANNSREFIPGNFVDGGEVTIGVIWDSEVDYITLMTNASAAFTITANTDTWVTTGFATGFEFTGPMDDAVTGTITVKIDSAIAQTTNP